MPNPDVSESISAHEIKRRRFYRRLFHWGIVFWVLAWIYSVLVAQSVVVNLKGWRGMQFGTATGSCMMILESSRVSAANDIHWNKPSFFWSKKNLEYFSHHPEAYLCAFGCVGSNESGGERILAFPIAGVLWLWLIVGWPGEFKIIRWAEFWRKKRSIGQVVILVTLPLLIAFSSYNWQIILKSAVASTDCILNLRNIQQAMRAYASAHGIPLGSPIDLSKVFGPGNFLPEHAKKCPGGQIYRLQSSVPIMGVLAAECPNPEHQRRLKKLDTTEW